MIELDALLIFLSSKQTIIIGATVTLTEVVVTIINAYRKVKAAENKNNALKLRVTALNTEPVQNTRFYQFLISVINPLNLFKTFE